MFRTLMNSTYYQLLIFFRLNQALFFSLIFPVFLFVVFGSIWGASGDESYYSFILSGIIGMTLASEGIFSIGGVIKEYYSNGLIKYLRKMSINVLMHFSGLILSRLISLSIVVMLLCVSSSLIFGYTVTFSKVLRFLFGSFLGLFIFSFMGLCISFSGIKSKGGMSITNIIYFLMIFCSDTYVPVGDFNEIVGRIGDFFPLNGILEILRGGKFSYYLIAWAVLPIALFTFLFNGVRFTR